MKIALIGAGNMGEAIIAGVSAKNTVFVCEPRKERHAQLIKKYKVRIGPLGEVVAAADVVIVAVKPQDFPDVMAEISTLPLKSKLVVSIAAGVTTRAIEAALKQPARVIRVMPNLPALIGEGMSALTRGKHAKPADLKTAKTIFETVGKVIEVPEKMIDGVTAVSGSGPAYVFLFVESMINAARDLGFSPTDAKTLVYQTLLGSAHLLEQSDDTAENFRIRVTSKGGTTQAALDVFSAGKLSDLVGRAVNAAQARAKELSK